MQPTPCLPAGSSAWAEPSRGRVTCAAAGLRIGAAGGGHVLHAPGEAFAADLPPLTTSLPLQRILVLIAAVLLPLEVGLRRLRLSPADLLEWLRHPRHITVALPAWAPELPAQLPAWVPGAWKPRPSPAPTAWPARRSEPGLRASVTPGLARESPEHAEPDEDDALGAATRWLAARRATRGDRG